MTYQLTRILRGLGAATVLIAVVVGLPPVLLAWGRSPLEGTGSIWDRLQEPLSDTVVFGLMTWTAWAAWAVFTLHVGIEIAAACGASRWRIPAFGPVGLSARKLVTAITMSITLAGPLTQRAGASPIPPPAASEIAPADNPAGATPAPPEATPEPVAVNHAPTPHPRQTAPSPPSDAEPPTPNDPADAREPTITVAPGDTPWGLAERHLGDGIRWREIWDLNRGVEQPDGHAWVCEDLIYPGWQFRLPGDATGLPQDRGGPTQGTGRETPPSSTELPPEPSDTNEPPVTDSSAPSTTSTTEAPDRAEDDPSGLPQAPEDRDGEVAAESESATTTTTQPPSTSSTIPPVESNDTVASPEPTDDLDEGDEQQDGEGPAPVVPLLGAAAALLSAGVLRELRRRRTRATAPRPLRKAPPPSPQPDMEREVLLSADDDQADRLDSALVHLARSLRPRPGQDCPQPLVVQIEGQRVDVCMDRPDPAPPAPWRPEASGLVWVLDPDHEVSGNPDAIQPAPSLVTIGTDGDADILVHLEAHGVIALTGDPDICRGVARSIVAELSTRAEGTVACTVIGDHLNELGASWDGVHHVDTWSDSNIGAIDSAARLLDTANWPHTWAARSSGRVFDGWPPTVFVSGHSDDPRYRQALEAASSRPGTGTAVVVLGGDPGCGLHIDIDGDGTFSCPQLHLTGAAQVLDADAATDLGDLLEHADDQPTDNDDDDEDGVPADIVVERLPTLESPGRNGQDDTDGETGSDAPVVVLDEFRNEALAPQPNKPSPTYEDPAWDVLVRLCGEISIEGGRSDLGPREKAVVTYVALHGNTDFDRIQDAVWAGSAVTKKRLQNVISTARGAVGDALLLSGEGRISAGTGLTTDLELIQRRTNYAKHQSDPVRRTEILRTGLALVTGKVCTCPPGGRRAWAWLELDGWISHAERTVGTAASELAQTYLAIEDCDGAAWAAQKGIEAIGRREELVILLVRSHEMAGDEQAARDVIREYEAWLADLGVDEHNEELLTLLERYAPPSHSKGHAQE